MEDNVALVSTTNAISTASSTGVMSVASATDWYPYLNNIKDMKNSLLLNPFNVKNLDKNLFFVCKEREKERRFASFKNYTEFLVKEDYFNTSFPHYYEIIVSIPSSTDKNINHFKMYFDIDCNEPSIEKEQIVKRLLSFQKFLYEVFEKKTNNKKLEVLLFDSSCGVKKSFHIVVDGVFFNDMDLVKNFVLYIKRKFNHEDFTSFIDEKVYKRNQQFRLLYSRKAGSEVQRTKKVFHQTDSFVGAVRSVITETKKDLKQFKHSLLTHVEGCEMIMFKKEELFSLLSEVKEKKALSKAKSTLSFTTLDEVDVLDVKHKTFIENFLDKEASYEIKNIVKTNISDEVDDFVVLIVLKREMETHCKICNRVHEKENPFIVVFNRHNKIKFFCRRHERGFDLLENERSTSSFSFLLKSKEPVLTGSPSGSFSLPKIPTTKSPPRSNPGIVVKKEEKEEETPFYLFDESVRVKEDKKIKKKRDNILF